MNRDLSQMSEEELQGAIRNVMDSPAFAQILGQLQGNSQGKEESKAAPPAITPDMMQKLPQMMSALAPLVGGGGALGKPAESGKGGSEGEKRKKLLSALRPYLSDNRREAVDQILKVTEMTDLLGTLGDLKPKS